MRVLEKTGLILFGMALALIVLEIALRLMGWAFLQSRESAKLPLGARAGHYRVLCLGESTTADMAFLGRQSYPAQLERILNERSSRIAFSVTNGGVPATRTHEIVEKLPGELVRHEPDIVVAMMGINDGGPIDPVLQVSDGLRVWKLATMLYYTLSGEHPAAGPPAPRDGRRRGPRGSRLTLASAFELMLTGQYDEAEALLLRLVGTDGQPADVELRVRAYGQLAVLNWQRGNQREADRYHSEFEAWQREYHNADTARSYQVLQRTLADRGVFLVAVQYPGRSVEPLARLLQPGPGVAIVDNEQTFLEALEARPVSEIYRDLFAGIFGHLTPYGNRLLAENVADVILERLSRDPDPAQRDGKQRRSAQRPSAKEPSAKE